MDDNAHPTWTWHRHRPGPPGRPIHQRSSVHSPASGLCNPAPLPDDLPVASPVDWSHRLLGSIHDRRVRLPETPRRRRSSDHQLRLGRMPTRCLALPLLPRRLRLRPGVAPQHRIRHPCLQGLLHECLRRQFHEQRVLGGLVAQRSAVHWTCCIHSCC